MVVVLTFTVQTKKVLEGREMQHLLHCQKEKSNILWLFEAFCLISIISNQDFLYGIIQSPVYLCGLISL